MILASCLIVVKSSVVEEPRELDTLRAVSGETKPCVCLSQSFLFFFDFFPVFSIIFIPIPSFITYENVEKRIREINIVAMVKTRGKIGKRKTIRVIFFEDP